MGVWNFGLYSSVRGTAILDKWAQTPQRSSSSWLSQPKALPAAWSRTLWCNPWLPWVLSEWRGGGSGFLLWPWLGSCDRLGNTQLPSSTEGIAQPLTLSCQESCPLSCPIASGSIPYSALLEVLLNPQLLSAAAYLPNPEMLWAWLDSQPYPYLSYSGVSTLASSSQQDAITSVFVAASSLPFFNQAFPKSSLHWLCMLFYFFTCPNSWHGTSALPFYSFLPW